MKITKFEHSCLLVEADGKVALFDPGEMSVPLIDVSKIDRLDYIFITHEHFDHLDVKFIKDLSGKFPKVQIITTNAIVDILAKEDIKAVYAENDDVKLFNSSHEGHPPFLTPPENTGIHFLDKLSHPGDSHSFSETKDILALPVTAPWGSTDRAVQLALELKPKHIIPIHDWHWKPEVREDMYKRLQGIFVSAGIEFHMIRNTESIVIN